MIGAGFIKDMINSSRGNRKLLKGENGKFKNFDKESYPTGKKRNLSPQYKDATPLRLESIRKKLINENKKAKFRKIAVFIFSLLIVSILIFLIGKYLIFLWNN